MARTFPPPSPHPLWDDLRVDMNAARVGGSSDPTFAVFRSGVRAFDFSASATNELFFAVQLPHAWEPQSTIKPHVHFSVKGTGTGGIRWSLEYSAATVNGDFPASSTLAASYTIASNSQYKHMICGLGDISMAGMQASTMIQCRISRVHDHADDTYGAVASLLEVDFHYQITRLGTLAEWGPE